MSETKKHPVLLVDAPSEEGGPYVAFNADILCQPCVVAALDAAIATNTEATRRAVLHDVWQRVAVACVQHEGTGTLLEHFNRLLGREK